MAEPRPWTVYRPGPIVRRAPDLWTIDDDVPGLPGANRRMSIVRRPDDSLVFFNAVPVPADTLAQVRALGRPAALIVPNALHALDAGPFARTLDVQAFAPVVAIAPLSSRVACRPIAELALGDALETFTVEGFRTKEIVLRARDTLFTADLVTNAPHGRGPVGLLMRLVGFTGPAPKLPRPVRRRVETNRDEVRACLESLSRLPGLRRLVPTHGEIVEGDVAGALRAIAATL